MGALHGIAPSELARQLALADGQVDRAVIEKLTYYVRRINECAAQAAQIAEAFPQLRVRTLWFGNTRGNMGMVWHELEIAAALAQKAET